MNKTIQELNLEDDFLFAKVMTDKEVCKKSIRKDLKYQDTKGGDPSRSKGYKFTFRE